jgi:DNA-binding LacI/PurR family transcriptional regulator
MADVARAAGVSKTLVSIVFRDAPGASAETRARVLAAASQIGYVRDERARMLSSRQSTDVGVVFSTQQPLHHDLLDGLYTATSGSQHNLILSAVSQGRTQDEAIVSLLAFRCGVIIALGPNMSDEHLLSIAQETPVVCVARPSHAPRLDWVASDDADGMRQAVNHLVTLGHQRITFLTSPNDCGSPERESGFLTAVHAAGVVGKVLPTGQTGPDGARAAAQILDSSEARPTALIAFNDRCAKGAMDMLVQRGLSVPRDMSIVGFDDSEIAQRDYVQLTTVRQDTAKIARFAAERALQRIAGIYLESQPPGLLVPTQLIVRETTSTPTTAGPHT